MSKPSAPTTRQAAVALRKTIRAIVRRFALSERADVACCDMTVAQAATLQALQATDSASQRELRRQLGISASTLSRNLDRLVERGLVTREYDRADARVVRASLTAAGHRAASVVEERELRFSESILNRVPSEDRDAVLDHMNMLLVAVRQATESCCPGAFDHLMNDFPPDNPGGRDHAQA